MQNKTNFLATLEASSTMPNRARIYGARTAKLSRIVTVIHMYSSKSTTDVRILGFWRFVRRASRSIFSSRFTATDVMKASTFALTNDNSVDMMNR